MTRKENIIQKICGFLEDVKVSNSFEFFRDKDIPLNMDDKEKLVVLTDKASEVIETTLSPRIETIEQTLELELSVKNVEGKDVNTELDSFEEFIKQTIKSAGLFENYIIDISFSQSKYDTWTSDNGADFKACVFDVVVVFDDF